MPNNTSSFGNKIGGYLIAIAILLAIVIAVLEHVATFIRRTVGVSLSNTEVAIGIGLSLIVLWLIAPTGGGSSSTAKERGKEHKNQ